MPDGGDFPLYESLKRDWCKGEISAKKVQEYALGAEAQGAVGMSAPAGAGSSGKHSTNIHRSLLSIFKISDGCPELKWVPIPTKRGPHTPHPFMLPHQWFASLSQHQPTLFGTSVRGPVGAAAAFWTMMSTTPFVRNHPSLLPKHWSSTIPLGFYGDSGSFSKQDSLYVFTWNSLLGTGQTMSKRYLATCIKKSDVVPGTIDAIFRIVAWSFNALLDGRWPTADWQGLPLLPTRPCDLAGGLTGCLCQIRGDWEFYCACFGFPKWNMAHNMCWLCAASANGPLSFSNFSDDAPWRATKRTHESYLAELAASGSPIPVLFASVIGLRLESVMIDVLHTCDQGVASHIIGNILWECMRAGAFGGGSVENKLVVLNKTIDAWYKEHKVTSKIKGRLTAERIRTSKSWPKLKAKAAATRHIAPFAHELACKFLDQKRIAITQMLCEFYDIMNAQGMFLDADAKERLPKLGDRMCKLYALLSREALVARQKAWKMVPKVHLLLHLCIDQAPSVGNPRFFWVYADEDLVGSMIEVAESCHASTMAPTAMVKWSIMAFEPPL